MQGVAFGETLDALTDAFDHGELARLTKIRLNEPLAKIAAPNLSIVDLAAAVLTWAEHRGIETDLIQAAYMERPRNDNIRRIYEKYGLASPASVQAKGAKIPGAPTVATALAFEATVRARLKNVDLGVWRERLAQIEGQVCRIEFSNNPKGTGFLVGPDLVLTNYHVMEQFIGKDLPPANCACRFDYKVLSDGSRSEGIIVELNKEKWLVDYSPYSQAEADDQPDRELPNQHELDYALLRLIRPIGDQPIDKNPGAGAPSRSWVKFPEAQPSLEQHMPLLIAQHPDGSPMKLALDTDAILGTNKNGTRVRYATNTDYGSSGSPCFDLDWSLVALHHMGDPAWHSAKFNQGVPIWPIWKMIVERTAIDLS
jgi:hypothetical protein